MKNSRAAVGGVSDTPTAVIACTFPVMLALAVLKERINMNKFLGMALIVVGVSALAATVIINLWLF